MHCSYESYCEDLCLRQTLLAKGEHDGHHDLDGFAGWWQRGGTFDCLLGAAVQGSETGACLDAHVTYLPVFLQDEDDDDLALPAHAAGDVGIDHAALDGRSQVLPLRAARTPARSVNLRKPQQATWTSRSLSRRPGFSPGPIRRGRRP